MKLIYGVLILGITIFFIYDIYRDGKYSKLLKSWTKYYKMAGIGFAGISLLLYLHKNPSQSKDVVGNINNIVKSMPLDKNTSNMFSPLATFVNPHSFFNKNSVCNDNSSKIIQNSGKKGNKRSVSETKKKFVAAQQSWTCNKCNKQLPAWFEVDHKIRLEYGGSNHIDNLEALCRDCHGRKTAMENL
jgi:5-methylcytosine-specific restriction endonuclease McrA